MKSFRILLVLFAIVTVAAQITAQKAPPKKSTPTPAPKKTATPVEQDDYDPDKLGPSEVACGRIGSKSAPPCGCMKVRMKARNEAMFQCSLIEDKEKRWACSANVPECPAVSDRDNPQIDKDGNAMPTQCKRWCSKARCECCTS